MKESKLHSSYLIVLTSFKQSHFGFHLLGQPVGTGFGMCLAVDADDGFCIALAQVHPPVLEVNLHTVDGGNFAAGGGVVLVGQAFKQAVHIHACGEVNAVLGDDVVGIARSPSCPSWPAG